MPALRLDMLPLPSLRSYCLCSVTALAFCIYFAAQSPTTYPPSTISTFTSTGTIDNGDSIIQQQIPQVNKATYPSSILNASNSCPQYAPEAYSSSPFYYYFTSPSFGFARWLHRILLIMMREPFCVWMMINMAFCWLVLLGRGIQRLVFGDLRVSEQQHLKDKFWNFVFYKFIFIFGVINVQYVDEVLLWCSWFAVLGFVNLLCQLCKDRFEYLSFSPTTPLFNHVKLLILLACIFTTSISLLLIAVFVGFFGGFNTFAFMSAEVILVSVRSLHIILKYILHLYDMKQEEKRGPVAYYFELGFELSALLIDFLHHLHMLLWSNIFLSMASLVICMQLRYLFHEIQRRYKKHKNYMWAKNHLEQNYPMASNEELVENSDNCAICWEKMESARKLPCSHLFHNSCLQSWLEQDTSCPTCRLHLNANTPNPRAPPAESLANNNVQTAARQHNHFFHFDGSRYVSWLPSFSVEVSHAQLLGGPFAPRNVAPNSQLDAMGRQVQTLFPHIPLSTIMNDLRITRSVEFTIENILDGRLATSTIFREELLTSPPPEISTSSSSSLSSPLENNALLPAGPSSSSTSMPSLLSVQSVLAAAPTNFDDDKETEDTATLGSRFSKSPEERDKIFRYRKEKMLAAARKKYLEKYVHNLNS